MTSDKYILAGNKRRYFKRKEKFIELLGGRCVSCGIEDDLEFDHIDPTTKKYNICKIINYRDSVVLEELKKCQLLCTKCHKEKTSSDSKLFPKVGHTPWNKGKIAPHGTHTRYSYGCRCEPCKEAKKLSRKRPHVQLSDAH